MSAITERNAELAAGMPPPWVAHRPEDDGLVDGVERLDGAPRALARNA